MRLQYSSQYQVDLLWCRLLSPFVGELYAIVTLRYIACGANTAAHSRNTGQRALFHAVLTQI